MELAEQARIERERLAAEAAERARVAEMQRRQTEAEGILAQRRQRLAEPVQYRGREQRPRFVEGAPEGFTLPVARYRGRPQIDYRDVRYTPEIGTYEYMQDLPPEQYEYFYGENPSLAVDRRNAARRAQIEAQRRAQFGGQTNAPFSQAANRNLPLSPGDRAVMGASPSELFTYRRPPIEELSAATGPIGRAVESIGQGLGGVWEDITDAYERVQQAGGLRNYTQQLGREWLLENTTLYEDLGITPPMSAFPPGERYIRGASPSELFSYRPPQTEGAQTGAARGTGGALERTGSGGALEITRPERIPYSPHWVDRWLDQQTELSPEDIYMLQVVNALEQESYDESGGYSSGGGGGYGGGGGGGGYGGYTPYTYTPSSYGSNYRRSPTMSRIGSMGLTSWRI